MAVAVALEAAQGANGGQPLKARTLWSHSPPPCFLWVELVFIFIPMLRTGLTPDDEGAMRGAVRANGVGGGWMATSRLLGSRPG